MTAGQLEEIRPWGPATYDSETFGRIVPENSVSIKMGSETISSSSISAHKNLRTRSKK